MFKPLLILDIIVILVLLARCAVVKVDKPMSSYYEEYMGMVHTICPSHRHYGVIIKFGKTSHIQPNAIAYCSRGSAPFYMITVNKDYWNVSTDLERKSTMFHELSHCELNLDHVNNPYNYMFPMEMPIKEENLIEQVQYDIARTCEE